MALDDGEYAQLGCIGMTRDQLGAFAATLRPTDHVVVETTGNATAVLEILAPHVGRVAVSNPLQVHLIANAKTKTDKIDARLLAKLYAAGFLPEVWIPDEQTLSRRRNVTRRNQLVKSRVRVEAMTQSIIHALLVPSCPHSDLFGVRGRLASCAASAAGRAGGCRKTHRGVRSAHRGSERRRARHCPRGPSRH